MNELDRLDVSENHAFKIDSNGEMKTCDDLTDECHPHQSYEMVLKDLGGFSYYQWRVFILVSLFEIPAAWAMMLPIITSSVPRWSCNTSHSHYGNNTYNMNEISQSFCLTNGSVCPGLTFDSSDLKSIVSEWMLVCGSSTIASYITSIQMGGVLVGAIITGQLADIYGRRRTLCGAYLLMLIFWFSSAFSHSWKDFAVFRCFVGASIGGFLVVNFVLPMEFILPKWRTFCGCVSFWAVGFMSLALWGYLIRDWRTLTISMSSSGVVLLILWWWIPESPRWLLYHGRLKEALAIIEDIARYNGRPMPHLDQLITYFQNQKSKSQMTKKRYSYCHLFSSWRMLSTSLILMYLWCVSSSVYYGMSLNARNLAGNRYLNIFLSGLAEVPALIFILVVNNRFGRKKTLFGLLLLTAIFCFSVLILDSVGKLEALSGLAVAFSLLGKSAISGTWAGAQILSAECFPTVIRNIGIASCSMSARIGGIIAPQLVHLGEDSVVIPFTVFGCMAIIGAVLSGLLPEKKGIPLPDVLTDVTHNRSIELMPVTDLYMDPIHPNTKVVDSCS